MTAASSDLATVWGCKVCQSRNGSCRGSASENLLAIESFLNEAHMEDGGAFSSHEPLNAVEAWFAREMLHAGHPLDLAEILGFKSTFCCAYLVDGGGCWVVLLRKLAGACQSFLQQSQERGASWLQRILYASAKVWAGDGLDRVDLGDVSASRNRCSKSAHASAEMRLKGEFGVASSLCLRAREGRVFAKG